MRRHEQTKPFYGVIRNGKPILDDQEGFQALKDSLEGCRIEIYLTRSPDPANSAQMRFYRAIVREYEEFSGGDNEQIHAEFKRMFGVKSTANLNKEQFTQFIGKCIRLCAEYGCVIEDPPPK